MQHPQTRTSVGFRETSFLVRNDNTSFVVSTMTVQEFGIVQDDYWNYVQFVGERQRDTNLNIEVLGLTWRVKEMS